MYEIYTILNGDTMESIADKYGTTTGIIMQINGLSDSYIFMPGNQIVVPVENKQPYRYYTVKKGDNMYEIAKMNNIDYNLLLQLNGLDKNDYIYPNQTIILPKIGLNIYLTKEDDSLGDILKKIGISIEELMNENKKVYLRPEQIIVFRNK